MQDIVPVRLTGRLPVANLPPALGDRRYDERVARERSIPCVSQS